MSSLTFNHTRLECSFHDVVPSIGIKKERDSNEDRPVRQCSSVIVDYASRYIG